MTKVNRCLRGVFIVFNGIFACLGGMMVYGTIKATAFSNELSSMGGPSLAWSWVFVIGILGISCLGLYAGKKEHAILLKVFAGFMVVGMIIMMILGILAVVAKSKVTDVFHTASPEVVQDVMQDPSMKEALEELQLHGHCCGVWHPSDWGNHIPASCNCNYRTEGLSQFGLGQSECTSKPEGSMGPSRVYARPCGEVVVFLMNMACNIAMGVCFGFAVIALLGLLISLLMIHQIKRYDGTGRVGIPMKGF